MSNQYASINIQEYSLEPQEQPQTRRNNVYTPGQKCGKWSDQEHMKYIVFIDYHKQKMRSKEKRRSNKFYQQMSKFIKTRNSLQCRSHHQKLQEKYTHVNKIINTFKQYFDKKTYKNYLDSLDFFSANTSMKSQQNELQYRSIQVQTDIGDIRNEFFLSNPNMVLIKNKKDLPSLPTQSQITLVPNNMFTSINISTSHSLIPTYNYNPVGMFTYFLPSQ